MKKKYSEKTLENAIQEEIKHAAKALVAVHIDSGSNGIVETVRLSRVPQGLFAPQLLAALEKMVEVFGAAYPPGVGLTLGDIACDEARAAIEQANTGRM